MYASHHRHSSPCSKPGPSSEREREAVRGSRTQRRNGQSESAAACAPQRSQKGKALAQAEMPATRPSPTVKQATVKQRDYSSDEASEEIVPLNTKRRKQTHPSRREKAAEVKTARTVSIDALNALESQFKEDCTTENATGGARTRK